jgi:Domain of unknown function (DUF1844)
MSDTPKFEVIDRRKMKADEERETGQQPAQTAAPQVTSQAATSAATAAPAVEPAPGPRLVANEPRAESAPKQAAPAVEEPSLAAELPPPPTAEETSEQKAAYDASTQRLEDLIRAQNPAAGPQAPVGFEHLVQQLYLTAMLQMGAGTQEGQRPRVDIVGARSTVDLIGVLAEKTRGNLTAAEDQMLQTVLFEARMAFLELTSMMTVQPVPPAPATKK